MNLPMEWAGVVREKVKKRANEGQDAPVDGPCKRKKQSGDRGGGSVSEAGSTSFHDACGAILQSIHEAIRNCTPPKGELSFAHIMTSAPYKCLVESLFVSDEGRVPMDIPVITRGYEESFMRGAMYDGEPLCVMGSKCECNYIDDTKPFVGIRFILPHGSPMPDNLCVCCHRRVVQDLYYDLLYSGRPFRGLLQKYGVIANEPNEYCIENLLICPAGGPIEVFPLPSVVHQRNRYKVLVRHNVPYLDQQLPYPQPDQRQGFRLPSP